MTEYVHPAEMTAPSAPPTVLAVIPGLRRLLMGEWEFGFPLLVLWAASCAIIVLSFERVTAFGPGPIDLRVAILVVLATLLLSWYLSIKGTKTQRRSDFGSVGQWRLAARAFRKNRLAVLGAITIVFAYYIAAVTPLVAPFEPGVQGNLEFERLLAPSSLHLFGTDDFARDVFSRVLYGARISLSIGFIAVGISVTIGTALGATAGYLGGWADRLIMRFVDVVISFPRLVLLIAIIAVFDASIFLIIAVLGLTQWPGTARIVRGEVLSLREREFIQAARALGYSGSRIVFRHLVPNTLAPVIVAATLGIGNTIVLEAGLSFLGLGLQPPTASWGSILSAGRSFLTDAWWMPTFAGLAIVITVLALNVVGDGLRDALDPRLRD